MDWNILCHKILIEIDHEVIVAWIEWWLETTSFQQASVNYVSRVVSYIGSNFYSYKILIDWPHFNNDSVNHVSRVVSYIGFLLLIKFILSLWD